MKSNPYDHPSRLALDLQDAVSITPAPEHVRRRLDLVVDDLCRLHLDYYRRVAEKEQD